MTKNTGWIFYQPFYFYLLGIIKENIFTIFSLLGIFYIFLRKDYSKMLLLSVFLFAFVPFSLTAHKEMRFLLLSLPLLYIITAYGLITFLNLFNKKQKMILIFVVLLFFFICCTSVEI